MHQNRIQSKGAKSLQQLLTRIRMARLSPLAAVALGIVASLSPDAAVEAYLRPMIEKAAFAVSANESWLLLAVSRF
jgi:hypothetical protein